MINDKEIKSVSLLEPFTRYQYLIKRAADFERLYTLLSHDGSLAISDIDDKKLYPLWPFKEFATNCAFGEWNNFKIVEIELNQFLDEILPQIVKDGFLLNIFPVGDKTG